MKQHSLSDILKKKLQRYISMTVAVSVTLLTLFQILQMNGSIARDSETTLSLIKSQSLHLFNHYTNDLSLLEDLYGKQDKASAHSLTDKIIARLSFDRVDVLDPSGILVDNFPSDPARIGFDLSCSEGYRLAAGSKETTMVNTAVFDSTSGKIVHIVTRRTGFGYLIGYANPQDLRSLLTTSQISGGHLAIVDNHGQYLAHTMDHVVDERQTDPYFPSEVGSKNSGKLVLYLGNPYFMRMYPLWDNHLTLLYYLSLSAYWHFIASTILNAILSLLAMGLILRFVVNRSMLRMNQAFTTLRMATQNIATGVYTHDVNKNTYIELHPLIESFLDMSHEVEKREEEVARLHHEREANFLMTITLMAKAIEAKDQYTGDHCERVKHYALLLGKALCLDPESIRSLTFGSILHDIGKIGIDERLLNKPGRLEPDECARIKEHCRIGASIIGDVTSLKHTHDIILYHHEAVDGSGYPHGLKGEEIPLLARIVSIADAYDAMTSLRPYRQTAMSTTDALQELERCAGKQFSPDLVSLFIACVEKENELSTSI